MIIPCSLETLDSKWIDCFAHKDVAKFCGDRDGFTESKACKDISYDIASLPSILKIE
jgi:hypothetical protein